ACPGPKCSGTPRGCQDNSQTLLAVECRFIEHVTYPLCLYPEEHVPDLVDYLWIAAGLSTREALEGSEDEIRGVFKVENGLHIIKVVGRRVAVLAVLDGHAPLTAPFTVYFDADYCVYSFGGFLVYCNLH